MEKYFIAGTDVFAEITNYIMANGGLFDINAPQTLNFLDALCVDRVTYSHDKEYARFRRIFEEVFRDYDDVLNLNTEDGREDYQDLLETVREEIAARKEVDARGWWWCYSALELRSSSKGGKMKLKKILTSVLAFSVIAVMAFTLSSCGGGFSSEWDDLEDAVDAKEAWSVEECKAEFGEPFMIQMPTFLYGFGQDPETFAPTYYMNENEIPAEKPANFSVEYADGVVLWVSDVTKEELEADDFFDADGKAKKTFAAMLCNVVGGSSAKMWSKHDVCVTPSHRWGKISTKADWEDVGKRYAKKVADAIEARKNAEEAERQRQEDAARFPQA